MEAKSKINNNWITNKIICVLDSIDQTRRCSVCNSGVYPARLEYYQEDLLIYFEFCNNFCQECGLFEYEPEKNVKIEFSNPKHHKIYLNAQELFK